MLYFIPKQKIFNLGLRDNIQQVNVINRVCMELLFFFQILLWKSNSNLLIWGDSTLTCSQVSKNLITSNHAQAEENYFQKQLLLYNQVYIYHYSLLLIVIIENILL